MKFVIEILVVILVTYIFHTASGDHPLAEVMSLVGMVLAAIYILGCEILDKLEEISKDK